MEAAEENIICPYPGLRPFREDESIFLRGRDEHVDQITRQLEQKKFLMLTGASGDGKSSLVYAGLIPNARAGFFKAKFNNWQVVDFRPERAPLQNLEDALAARFSGDVRERFRRELKFGFSSLIDIYTDSPHYIDKSKPEFTSLSEADQRKAMRKGSNLLILVDQFEEFFTNSENYFEGRSSADAQLVVSMLLETCRIATERDLPVYVVCTMRSDYIGQCASFRGLPEAIGYSQFFVPRLKRKEIYQVIEEPAQLNGNTISKRLVEMLLHQMGEGIDQLPVLQHALNQIWHEAGKGAEEMDLIHFAKAGGVDVSYLPEGDKEAFTAWKAQLPEWRIPFYEQPSLDNVLDRHANDLYHTAHAYFLERNPGHALTREQAREIIEAAFRSLTKIDASRSVRNRMTLREIVHIVNRPGLGLKEVGGVLEIFRLPGNTFLKPFHEHNEAQGDEQGEWIMDITHESLIRNWGKLIEWSHAEEQDHQTWLDFAKQLKRWIDNGKTTGYLLPIGPLNFFETWFEQKQPNEHWLMKYDERDISYEQKLEEARATLTQARRFIRASIGKLFFSRFVMKHGAQRVALWTCMVILLFFCEYFRQDYVSKTNESVVRDAEYRGIELLSSARVTASEKARFIINYEGLHPGTMDHMLQRCGGDSVQLLVMKDVVQKYLPNNVEIVEDFNSLKPKIATQLNGVLGGYAERLLRSASNQHDSSDIKTLIRLADVSSLIYYSNVKLGFLPESLDGLKGEIQKLLWRDLVIATIHKQDTAQSYDILMGSVDFAITNGIARDSIQKVIKLLKPILTDSTARFLKTVPSSQLKVWIAGLHAYCGQTEECLTLISTNDYRELDKSSLYSIVAKAWLGHDSFEFPEIILQIHGLLERDGLDRNIQGHQSQLQNLSLGMLCRTFNSNIPEGLLLTANPWLNFDSTFGLLYLGLRHRCIETICNAYEGYLTNAEIKYSINPAENVFQKIMSQKIRLEFASANKDTTQCEELYKRFYSSVLSLDNKFLGTKIELEFNKDLRASYSRAIWILCPNFYGGSSLEHSSMEQITQINQHYPNYIRSKILYSDWATKYEWSRDDLLQMKQWLFNSEFKVSPYVLPEQRYLSSNYLLDLYNFISERLNDSDKDEEFMLTGKILNSLINDTEWTSSNSQFLTKDEELATLRLDWKISVIVSKELVYTGSIQSTYGPSYLIYTLMKGYLRKKIICGQTDSVVWLFQQLEDDEYLKLIMVDLMEMASRENQEESAQRLMALYINKWPTSINQGGGFFLSASRIGSSAMIQHADNCYRNNNETQKMQANLFYSQGYLDAGKFFQAFQRIPDEYSYSAELQFLSRIIGAQILEANSSYYNSNRNLNSVYSNFFSCSTLFSKIF